MVPNRSPRLPVLASYEKGEAEFEAGDGPEEWCWRRRRVAADPETGARNRAEWLSVIEAPRLSLGGAKDAAAGVGREVACVRGG